VPFKVFGFRAGGLRRNGQWLAFVGLEVLGHGRVSEMVTPDETPGQAREGAQTSRSSVSKVMRPRSKALSWRVLPGLDPG
jgi:hypothetical protein